MFKAGEEIVITDEAKTPLPNIPSALIRIAIKDLEACEISDRYTINMGNWHRQVLKEYNYDSFRWVELPTFKCSVCLAGAVMSQTLGTNGIGTREPSEFPADEEALVALDALRQGDFTTAFIALGYPMEDSWAHYDATEEEEKNSEVAIRLSYPISAYTRDTAEVFKKEMLSLATELEKEGY